ncbi:RlmE family RNA methyltransferase [Spirochaetia bacterium 38H-sp]|uniref:Ribosomal RNA large subunit methyltransferase E n=1 Tax=Rarispira pelagica TaxID=3141764 RepID=A0ABU9U9G5_9SPIR
MKWDDDYYTQKAKKDGYPARSVYKLMEIDKKYKIIKQGYTVLDIGAAPGSWSKYILTKIGKSGRLLSIDLNRLEIKEDSRMEALQGDIYSKEIQDRIAEYGQFDLVVSDIAPTTSGNRNLDTARSEALVEEVIGFAEKYLKTGGDFVAKLFQGPGRQAIMDRIRANWTSAHFFKPQATRKQSFEVFIIGIGKK